MGSKDCRFMIGAYEGPACRHELRARTEKIDVCAMRPKHGCVPRAV